MKEVFQKLPNLKIINIKNLSDETCEIEIEYDDDWKVYLKETYGIKRLTKKKIQELTEQLLSEGIHKYLNQIEQQKERR